jgi:nicotinate-nucleotide adenylyltransferase
MNIGLFGGTFDPVHHGHLALARAAKQRFELGRIHLVPANIPPHKANLPMASYCDRYAMLGLATTGEKGLLPSLLEAPGTAMVPAYARDKKAAHGPAGANYSIDTVRRLKQTMKKKDRLFFLIGIDAFKDIANWREPEALFRECEFIVASRPGYSLADVANALPESLRPASEVTKPFARQPAKGDLMLSGVTVHLLDNMQQPVSATSVREAVAAHKALGRLVCPAVADYIRKMGLYTSGRSSRVVADV